MEGFFSADAARSYRGANGNSVLVVPKLPEFIGVPTRRFFPKRRARLLNESFKLLTVLPDDLESLLKIRKAMSMLSKYVVETERMNG